MISGGHAKERRLARCTGDANRKRRGDTSVLTRKIRVVSSDQIHRTWFSAGAVESAQRRLRVLAQAGYLDALTVRVHPELALETPVWNWKPGEAGPPIGIISYRLRSRWTEAFRPVTVYVASKRTARFFGGSGGRLRHPLQASHDIHVSAIYLNLLRSQSAAALLWVPEERFGLHRRGQKLPDAELQDAHGRTLKVIEFGGSYPPERVRKVHEDCERRGVPYELW